jgi:hypothetical protein
MAKADVEKFHPFNLNAILGVYQIVHVKIP